MTEQVIAGSNYLFLLHIVFKTKQKKDLGLVSKRSISTLNYVSIKGSISA